MVGDEIQTTNQNKKKSVHNLRKWYVSKDFNLSPECQETDEFIRLTAIALQTT